MFQRNLSLKSKANLQSTTSLSAKKASPVVLKVLPLLSDVVVFSHLGWDFVFQRPQHLLTRCALKHRVFYVEEPFFHDKTEPHLEIKMRKNEVRVVVPHLSHGLSEEERNEQLAILVDRLLDEQGIEDYVTWYYTPMALAFTSHLRPLGVIYDCMDELSMFKGAHPQLLNLEAELFRKASVVFTGGRCLFEHKRDLHHNIHAFPSSIEADHFGKARLKDTVEPADQKDIVGPKIGFFGVIDERMDLGILDGLASSHPEWSLVILGPVIKIDPQTLPRHKNIHYLGGKHYSELPSYIKGWDVAILPFALNESTRFISPTKTPEYLAAGVPVVSTSIRDVVYPYEEKELVLIADTPEDFVKAVEQQLKLADAKRAKWLARTDEFLAAGSWNQTWENMYDLIHQAVAASKTATHSLRTDDIQVMVANQD